MYSVCDVWYTILFNEFRLCGLVCAGVEVHLDTREAALAYALLE